MRQIPIILFGLGGVGSALLRQIVEQRVLHAEQYGIELQLSALCDSSGAVTVTAVSANAALGDQILQEILQLKSAGGRLLDHRLGKPQGDLAAIVDRVGCPGAIVVDCTASRETVPALLLAMERSYQVALVNKIPLTVEMETYDRLTGVGAAVAGSAENSRSMGQPLTRNLTQSRWETTVGAGLPVIATLNRLVASGDPITRIAGALSGTLGYVMTGLEGGASLSEIVCEAHRLGYTEPDPRDDLGGIDVARKALILARGLGWQLSMEDVQVEGLYPSSMGELSVTEFLEALPELDAEFAQRVADAAAAGKVLRYAATIEGGKCRVGPTVVERESPLGRLSGTDNLVEFHSRWYNPNPLVIQGSGAGTDVTAAGLLSDIVELAFAR